MDKTITKITYNGQELSIYIPSMNITLTNLLSSRNLSSFIDTTGFFTKLRPTAIAYQTGLRTVDLPRLSKVEENMFAGCSYLSSLEIPKVTTIPQYLFQSCVSLNYDTTPIQDVKEIDSYGLYQAWIESVNFSNCTKIGDGAFDHCTNVKTINLPKCSTFGSGAFSSCWSLLSVSLPLMTKIPEACFYYCYRLTSINTENITEIGSRAFASCSALTELTFSNVDKIGGGVFYHCTNLSKLKFTKISNYSLGSYGEAFEGLTSSYLKELVLNTTGISSALYFPRMLEKLEMPYLTYFDTGSLLKDYRYLKEVNLDSLSVVGSSANLLYGCSSLEKISLPNLLSAGYSAFYGCSKLSQAVFTFPSVVTLSNASCFRNTPMQNSTYLGYYGSIYVPARLVSAYKSATNWAQYSDRITSIDNLPQN